MGDYTKEEWAKIKKENKNRKQNYSLRACRYCFRTSGITFRKVGEDLYICVDCLKDKQREFEKKGKLK
ncbi:MAG: hypothetical protein COZ07_08070 [Candidatus Infernicultor aquiphilus]|uniref:Uncharacterized protein n=1 Tax=Candidatus Infernicultor aquiphilus TaxID=1805029 RepID=A0A2M7PN57_9BACT|nr:MAG: hypothetical protein COZ85_01590 [Candidatus Moranbacteria bacterium CG_4_8_14_3_um_filter_34_16]PIY31782.1 MAG: hypothetical protein COZ07_08070 [Candidatus Atribacteria bacterium CG_4_10_14_3_um_filter_34_13]